MVALAFFCRGFFCRRFLGFLAALGSFFAAVCGLFATLGLFAAFRSFLTTFGCFLAAFRGFLAASVFSFRDFFGRDRRGLLDLRGGHGLFFRSLFTASKA